MKIEKITENKIRIIINIDELAKKNIDIVSLAQDNEASKKMFKKMLLQAEKEVDFHFADSQLLIEAFIASNEFFVIVFTKISDGKPKKVQPNRTLRLKSRKNISTKKNVIYQFETFDEFCDFCTYFKNINIYNIKNLAKNIFLYEYNSKYFLVLVNTDIKSDIFTKFHIGVLEFAIIVSDSFATAGKLFEYGKIVFKGNALNHGIKYFSHW